MTEQQKFIVTLLTDANLSSLHSNADRNAELTRASNEVKAELCSRIPAIALMTGSAIDVNPQLDSIMPVVCVKATDAAAKLLAADPIVKHIGPAPNFRLASSPAEVKPG